jgi:hypothetical protein
MLFDLKKEGIDCLQPHTSLAAVLAMGEGEGVEGRFYT